jgi:hypothetical protein
VDLPDPVVRFLWGVLGAVAQEIVRIYRITTGVSRGRLPVFGLQYFLSSVAYAIIGGFIVLASGKTSPIECVWIGVSIPAIISYVLRRNP